MKNFLFSPLLLTLFFSGIADLGYAFGNIEGYWIRIGAANGAPNFLSITHDTMQIDRRRPVKISTMQAGDEVIVRTNTSKNKGYGLSDNSFDAMNVVNSDTMLVTRPSPVAGQPARQTIYRRIGYDEAKKYLPRKARRARR